MAVAPGVSTSETLTDLLDRIGRMRRCMQFAEGLNPAQWECLRFLSRANCFSRTPSGLATFLGTTKGTVSQTLIALEGKGYVRRRRDVEDRRVTHLELTDSAHEVLAKDPMVCLDRAVSRLPGNDSMQLMGTLGKLADALEGKNDWCKLGSCAKCGENEGETADGGYRCGLKGVDVPAAEAQRVCVSFACPAAAAKKALDQVAPVAGPIGT